MYLPVVGFAKH